MSRFFLCVFVFLCVQSSFGQSGESILKMLVEKQMISQEDADALKKESQDQKDNNNVLTKIKSAFNSSDIFKLSGYGQAVYLASDNAQVNSTMDVSRIILFATGNLSPKLGYMVMYNFGPKSGLLEYYGEYTPNVMASMRFGQFKVPFTLENPMSPTRWETIFTSLSIDALVGGPTDVIGPKSGRDIGLQVSGKLWAKNDFYRLEYAAGIFNGAGMNTVDNNNHKDFSGILIYQPVKGLKLSGSVYAGKAPYVLAGESVVRNHVRNRWSVGGEYSNSHWYARSEYLYGDDGGYHRNGYYGVAMWKILPDKLEIFGKYDFYDPDKDGDRFNAITQYTGGVNYYFGFLSRIQLNYIYTDRKTLTSNTFAAQLQLFF